MEQTTRKLLRDYGGTVVGAVLFALLIRFFVIEAFRIPTPAMRPTLEPGDTVFVLKAPIGTRLFGRQQFGRGDVVLFRPTNEEDGKDYIKRIVAVGGETVQIKGDKVFVDGKVLNEEFPPHGNCGFEQRPDGSRSAICLEPPALEDFGPAQVPSDSVFVMGDFRTGPQFDPKTSGKSWGIIPRSWFRGKAMWVWLSVEPLSPSDVGLASGRFPRVRFERMFRRIR